MKKVFSILTVIVLISIAALSFTLTGCDKKPDTTILYLGDSIAEGIAGMSPISERERYSYYGVVGIRNNYRFINYATSGSRSGNLLSFIKRYDRDVKMTRTTIKEADIIHVSILGNDLLLNDLGEIIYQAAQEDYTIVDEIVENSSRTFADIIWSLKALNPDATLFLQNVYNPVFEDSWLISDNYRAKLADVGVEPDGYREVAGIVVSKLNSIMSDYLEERPDDFYLMDAYAEFDRLYQEEPEWGRSLISVDDVHPSSPGHGVLADMTQEKLEELGLADGKKALKRYKEMKIEQLERLYSDSVDIEKATEQIKDANSCSEVTRTHFGIIDGKEPVY